MMTRDFGRFAGFASPVKALLLLLLISPLGRAATLKDIPYGDHPRHKLDIHLPEGKAATARPVIIGIHGGGWRMGRKDHEGFVHPKAEWFNGKGLIFVSINYRLSPEVTHPGHVEDVCRAIAWVQKHIAGHGGDPHNLRLIGHSAGAHLAALAALDHQRLKASGADPAAIRGVILLDGAAYDVPRQIANASLPRFREMYLNAFTKDPQTQRDASPTLKAADLKAAPAPFLILHVAGRDDSKDQADGLAKALQAKGGKASVVPVAGKTHGTINRDMGKPGDPTTGAVAAFLGI